VIVAVTMIVVVTMIVLMVGHAVLPAFRSWLCLMRRL
jgi:hypothetical protein